MRRAHAETVGVGQMDWLLWPWPGRSGAMKSVDGARLEAESEVRSGV
jgi:hypothetical protein